MAQPRDKRGRFKRAEKRSAPTSWDLMSGRGIDSAAGVPVSPVLAENLSAAFAAVQLVAQTLASLPVYIYRREGASRFEYPSHPVARLFAGSVNEHQTIADFMELMQANVLWHGNAYAEIIRDGSGAPVELIPHHPGMVSVERLTGRRADRRLRYIVSDIEGGSRRLLQEEMLHIRDRSDDGLVGKSRLQRAKEAFGSAIAVERFASSTYRNSARLSGFVSHPETLGEETSTSLQTQLERLYSGSENAGRIAVLEENMAWHALSVSPEDAQLLESRRFTVESVARMFGVPPQLIGDTSKSAYSNVVEASRHFARFTLAPWAAKWEQTIARSLFGEVDVMNHEVEVNLDDLLRGDPLQRAQTWRVLRELGVVNANEIRAEEGWNPRTDAEAEIFFAPLNLQREQTGLPKD
jgi:HK97 family phage portal protein